MIFFLINLIIFFGILLMVAREFNYLDYFITNPVDSKCIVAQYFKDVLFLGPICINLKLFYIINYSLQLTCSLLCFR